MVFRDGDLTWLEQDRMGRTRHRGEGVVRGAGGKWGTFTTSTDIHRRG